MPGTVAVYVPLWLVGERGLAGGPRLALGGALLLVGAAIYAWCVWDFASFGRGTPAPIDAPTRLVVRGLYHYVRNPMYVGVLTTILAWATLYGATALAVYAACAWLLFHGFILFYEEPQLERQFGAEYVAYRTQVGRWLPRLGAGPRRSLPGER